MSTRTSTTTRTRPNNKRRRQYIRQKSKASNPPRGQPGLLITCDTGREHKATREVLDLLEHDWKLHYATPPFSHANHSNPAALSLEDELTELRRNDQCPFRVYETGCAGTVFVICTASGYVAQPLRFQKHKEQNEDARREVSKRETKETDKNANDDEMPPSKRIKAAENNASLSTATPTTDKESGPTAAKGENDPHLPVVWNPIHVAQRLVADIRSNTPSYPGTRFVAKFLPMQATVWASPPEIQHAVLQLLQSNKCNSISHNTFAIRSKRRNCGHLTTAEIIQSVGTTVAQCAPSWTVHLTSPDYTILVQVCKSLAGISILPNVELSKFNVAELRDAVAARKSEKQPLEMNEAKPKTNAALE